MLRSFFIAVAAALCCAAFGCSSDTALLIRVDTDLRVPEELNGLRIRVTVNTDVKTLLDKTYSLGTQDDIPATLTVVAENGREVAVVVTVTGLNGGADVAEASVPAAFKRGSTVDVDIFLSKTQPIHQDGGHHDGATDASKDAGADSGERADGGNPEDGGVDTGGDAGTDAGIDAADTGPDAGGDTGTVNDAGEADANQMGFACDGDGGCLGSLACLGIMPGGYCTDYCTGDSCAPGAACVAGWLPDASFCVRTCAGQTDCDFRPGLGCTSVAILDASLCRPPQDGGGVDDAGHDAGTYPRIEVTQADPPGGKVGIGQQATFEAALYTAPGVKDDTAAFMWGTVETACIWFADPSQGVGTGAEIGPACGVIASAKGLMGQTTVSVEVVVSTYAGSGVNAHLDDPNPRAAQFTVLTAGDIDSAGNLYIVEEELRLRKIAAAGAVTTEWTRANVSCTDGDDQTFTFNHIADIAIDRASGDLYFSDAYCNSIRKHANGQVTTVFASTKGYTDGDFALAKMDKPTWLAKVGGGLYFYDSANYAIRLINLGQSKVSTVAGSGLQGINDGPIADSQLYQVRGIHYSTAHGLLFSDYRGYVRKTDGTTVTTLAGSGGCDFKDGAFDDARFCDTDSFFVDSKGSIYISDWLNHRIRMMKISQDNVTTVAGNANDIGKDGLGSEAQFFTPQRLIPANNGNSFYVIDQGNYQVRLLRFGR